MPLTPTGVGGPNKAKNIRSNVQILDLTYGDDELEFPPGSSRLAETTDSSMGESTVPDNQTDRLLSETKNTRSSKNENLFNLDQDKYYNCQHIYVFIEKTDDKKIGRLHPLYVGHILHKKLNLKNVIISIDRVGINRIKVGLKSAKDANDLVNNKKLQEENLRAFIPNNLLIRKGLIKGVDTYFNEEYLKDNIETENKILEIRRLKKKMVNDDGTTFVPRQMVVITFEGNILPSQVIMNSVILPVEPFVQRVTQCFKCLRYGHISDQCRSTKILCINCGKDKAENHICSTSDIFCLFCKNNSHNSTSKNCPHFSKQQKIKKQMAVSNMSFLEAKKYIDDSFSGAVLTSNSFSALSDPNNFPALPNSQNSSPQRTLPTNRTLSQPTYPSSYKMTTNTKKRRIQSPTITAPQMPPMFPFNMGPSQPLPPNTNKPSYEADKNKIIESLSNIFLNVIANIKQMEDLKNINNQFLKGEISSVLDSFKNS